MPKNDNVVRVRRPRTAQFATAADTFNIEALIRDLDSTGANSSTNRFGSDDEFLYGRRLAA
jgi:hypothetical protein